VGTLSRRRLSIGLAVIVGLGLVLRAFALRFEPGHHPDEVFQYLEPAWLRLSGAGVETWEWRADLRSWVLPGYHGAWMALLVRLGVPEGITLATTLRAHWALLSLTMVWAAWRGSALLARRLRRVPAGSDANDLPHGWQAGLLGALLCTAFPILVRFSVHTLSELASMICMVWALVLCGELVESPAKASAKTWWTGLLTGLGVCLRIQHAPVALVVAAWLLLARRGRTLASVVAVAMLPVALFGAVDWVTWGKPFASYIAYIKFNLIEKGADVFGTQPPGWYVRQFWNRLPVGLPLLGLLGLLGVRATWPFLASAVGLTALLSTQAHKEERFAMLAWPLLLVAAAGYAGAWLAARSSQASAAATPRPSRWRRAWTWAAAALGVALVLGDGAWHCGGNDFDGLTRSRFEAQAWIGRRPGVSGLLCDEPLYLGGYTWFGRPFPQLQFDAGLLANPLFSHVLVGRDPAQATAAQQAGFVVVHRAGDVVVLERREVPVTAGSEPSLRDQPGH
jgi:GPI mannosyltransferase 3